MIRNIDTIWTEELCEKLKDFWQVKGMSSSRVVAEFAALGYSITRNAVIGKVHRMKLVAPSNKAEKLRKRSADIMVASNKIRSLLKKKVEKQLVVGGKKFNPNRRIELIMAPPEKPKGSKMVLLKHSKDGMCKAIVGYEDGKLENAVYCGEDTTATIFNGRFVPSSWCPYHKGIYIQEIKK